MLLQGKQEGQVTDSLPSPFTNLGTSKIIKNILDFTNLLPSTFKIRIVLILIFFIDYLYHTSITLL